jgi:hypothetical protein
MSNSKQVFMLVDEINDMLQKHSVSQMSANDEVELTRTVSVMLREGLGFTPEFTLTPTPNGYFELEVSFNL